MATYATPTYSSGPAVSLPDPYEYQEFVGVRGASTVLADGTLRWQLVQSGNKRRFAMRWRSLDDTAKGVLETALNATATASKAFTSPNGGSYTIVLDEGSDTLEFTARMGPPFSGSPAKPTFYWDTNTLIFRET